MSNEIVDLKLKGAGIDPVTVSQPEDELQEMPIGSLRYYALHDSDVNSLQSKGRPTLVTLFGISECGKTTFVGSLFAILRRRPELLKVTFLDSDTLAGFEHRVYRRFLTKAGKSEILHTQRKSANILNVVLGDEQGENERMIVLSDLSGEVYKDAISKNDVVEKQTAVKYADKLVIFADVESLLSSKTYTSYKGGFKSLLNRFKDKGMLPNEAEIFLTFNKIDLVNAKVQEEAVNEDGEIDEVKKETIESMWQERKQTIINIANKVIPIPADNIFEVNSLGIQRETEDASIIKLFGELIREKSVSPLSTEYQWLQKLSKSKML